MGNRLHMGGGQKLPFTVPVHRAGRRHMLVPAWIVVGTCPVKVEGESFLHPNPRGTVCREGGYHW